MNWVSTVFITKDMPKNGILNQLKIINMETLKEQRWKFIRLLLNFFLVDLYMQENKSAYGQSDRLMF